MHCWARSTNIHSSVTGRQVQASGFQPLRIPVTEVTALAVTEGTKIRFNNNTYVTQRYGIATGTCQTEYLHKRDQTIGFAFFTKPHQTLAEPVQPQLQLQYPTEHDNTILPRRDFNKRLNER